MGNQSANVTFVPPANNGGLPIVEYVAMAFINGAPTGIFQTGGGSPIQVTGLANGQPYTFEVYAVNAVGIGPWSAPSNVFTPEPTVPSAPLSPSASPGNASATITFLPPATNGGDPVTGYTASDGTGVYSASITGFGPITVTGLTNGTGYTFTVVATNAVGNSLPSASVAVTPSGTATVPTAPLSPSAVAGNAQATVSFLPPASNGGATITGYTVTSSPGAPTGTGAASPIVVTGLTNGTAYTFTVTATNTVGTGPASVATAPVTPTSGVTVPGPPTAVTGAAGNTQVVVTFTAPASNGGATITGYTATSLPGGFTGSVTGAAASPITVAGLTNGQPYTFTVTATNSAGAGPASAPSAAVTPATVPGTPEAIAATPGNQSAQVTFMPPLSNGGSPITSYTATSTPGNIMGHSSASPINVTGLTNGQSYTFNVLATNAIGNGAYNGPSNAVIPSSVPGPPTNLVGTPANQAVSVAFTAPTNTGGIAITGYTVTSSGGQTADGTASPINVTELTNGTAYTFTAIATNADGNSVPSAASGSVTPGTIPLAPQNVNATAGDQQITVTFSPPSNNGGSAITSYTATSHPGSVTGSNGTNLSITLTGLTNGQSYIVSVAATNAFGTGESANSNQVTPEPSGGFVITGPSSLPNGQVGVTYPGATITAGGGASIPPYSYFNPAPLLPSGLSLNESTGAISGTPTTAGTFNPGFQATDSSGSASFPTSTLIALNQNYDGTPADQLPGGIQTSSSVPLVHGQLWIGLTTIATYGGAHQPPPSLQTLQGDSISLQTYIAGPQMPYINASQETSLFKCDSAVGGNTTFQQWYGPDGYGGNNPGDSDYQAFLAFQYNGTWIGYGAFTAQTGTNYGGVPQGTALESGPITISGSQVPCAIYGFCENTSQLGANYTPTPNVMSGITPTTILNTWNFAGTQNNTSCYASWNITAPGTYTPTFDQPSTSLQCSQTVGWAVKGSGSGNLETPVQQIALTINPNGGGSAPTLVQMLLQGQTSQNQATNIGPPNTFQPQNGNYTMIGWLGVSGASSYNIYRCTIPLGQQATGTLSYTLYATISASAAASAYSGYVSGSNGAPYQTAVNCAYGDTNALNCVNGTQGPTPGDLWAGIGYSYKVSAVVGGNESALSDPHYAEYISNGLAIMYLTCFNNTPNIAATTGGTTPTGNTKTIEWDSGLSPYWNPYCGNGATEWNLNLRAFNYVQFYIKANQAGNGQLRTAIEQENDTLINGGAYTYFPTTTGSYSLVKLSLASMMTDTARGRQNTFYKFGSFDVNGNSGTWWIDALRFVT